MRPTRGLIPGFWVCATAALFAVGCGSGGSAPSAPSPVTAPGLAPAASQGFGRLTTTGAPDLAACLGHPSPACFSANAALHSLRIGTRALSAPLTLTSAVAGNTVTLSWTAPAGAVSAYVLEAGSGTGLADLANLSTGNALTTFVATSVPAGTYYVRVRAVDSTSAAGPPSNEVVVVVGGGGCVAPGAPTGLTITINSGGAVGLQWNAAAGAPTNYVLEAGSAAGLANLANADVGPATTFATTGVGAGTYYVRVRARNACGTSAPSNEVTIAVGGTVAAGPVVSASVDGVPWTAATINASFASGRLTIGGTTSIWSVSFSFFPTGPGTYSIPAPGPSFAFVLSNANPVSGRPVPEWQTSSTPGVGGGGGSVTLTSLTTTGASGTFSFTLDPYLLTGATGTKSITGGVFNVTFR
jgi:hypothetical protein